MKLTFFRQGYANNSSSSHSIIFSNTNLESYDDDTNEFGWNYWTASTKKSKHLYFLICLYGSWQSCVELEAKSDMLDSDRLDDFQLEAFLDWVSEKKISNVKLTKQQKKDLAELITTGYVDHQSVFHFPCCRNIDAGLNVDFINFWFTEIAKPEYAILGGNDNGGDPDSHQCHSYDEREQGKIVKMLYRHFNYSGPKDNICVYDYKTKEFVISSRHNGNIIKFEAELQ